MVKKGGISNTEHLCTLKDAPERKGGKKMSKTDAESFLKKLESSKWLYRTEQGGIYHLGPRSYLENRSHIAGLREGEPTKCQRCKQECLYGIRCKDTKTVEGDGGACGCIVHVRCMRVLLKTQPSCPLCKSAWEPGLDRRVEKLKYGTGSNRRAASRRQSRKRPREDAEDADGSEEEQPGAADSEDEEGEPDRIEATQEDEHDQEEGKVRDSQEIVEGTDEEIQEEGRPSQRRSRRQSKRRRIYTEESDDE